MRKVGEKIAVVLQVDESQATLPGRLSNGERQDDRIFLLRFVIHLVREELRPFRRGSRKYLCIAHRNDGTAKDAHDEDSDLRVPKKGAGPDTGRSAQPSHSSEPSAWVSCLCSKRSRSESRSFFGLLSEHRSESMAEKCA